MFSNRSYRHRWLFLLFLVLLYPSWLTPQHRHANRDAWQKPQKVVEALGLKPGMVIVDLGAGYGYFTWHLADAAGPGGRVLALDIDTAVVETLREEARRRHFSHIEARVVAPDDPGLPPHSVDLIFLCNTYHHIRDRIQYFRRLRDALRPGGRLVIIDFYRRPLPVGPPPGHKLARRTVLQELQAAGYRLLREHTFLPYQYFLEFVPATENPDRP